MSGTEWLRQQELYRLVCRPALPKDTPDVIGLTRTIWSGEDYVPYVWADWLSDPQGLLAVAEYGGKVIGLSKLTRQSDRQWWLEGLRVHPAYEGRRVASHLHDYLLDIWQRTGAGVIRLATASFRIPVHHLAERTGFHKVCEITSFSADLVHDPIPHSFNMVTITEIHKGEDFISHSPLFHLTHGLIDIGWQWVSPENDFLVRAIQREQAWWWRDRAGLLIFREDEEDHNKTAFIQFLACSEFDATVCLTDFRRFGNRLGCNRVGWLAPLKQGLVSLLERAGYRRDWDSSLFLFEKNIDR
ncbi:MAG TPA: GNAT family N-acetyltransferase [Anaerolineales bacterium]|nr:GNAT family N-acetyltransferase [Anaerolineales bacterium]